MPHIFSRGLRQAKSQGGGPRGPGGPLLLEWFRLAAAARMMAVVMTTTMVADIDSKYNNQLKAAVEAKAATAMVTETKIN
jgi:hypothetical protein